MATITRNLKLRLPDNLTADSRYNLEKLDQLGAIFQLDSNQDAVVRSQGEVAIRPNDPAIGGDGTAGIVSLGDPTQPLEYAEINGPIKILCDNEINYTEIISTDTDNRKLTLNIQAQDRLLQLGGDLVISGGDITFETASDPIVFQLPITDDEVAAGADIAGSKIVPEFTAPLSAPSVETGVLINGATFNLPSVDGVPNAVLTTDGSGNLSFSAVTGTGTVTSVALALPDIFTVSGSPITDNGTLTGTLNTQAAHQVLAGPASGPDAVPTFRQLSTDDVTEGSNLFYTQARFDSALTGKTTDDVAEGSTNLYYNESSFDSSLAGKTTDDVSEGVTNLYHTDLRAQDAAGAILLDTATVDLSYVSGVSLSADVIASGLVAASGGLAESGNSLLVDPTSAAAKSGANPNDVVLIADSEDTNSLKKILLSDIVGLSGGSYATDWTSGTSITATHNLNSKDVIVQVFDNSTNETVQVDSVVRDTVDTVVLTASAAPSGAGLRILIKRI